MPFTIEKNKDCHGQCQLVARGAVSVGEWKWIGLIQPNKSSRGTIMRRIIRRQWWFLRTSIDYIQYKQADIELLTNKVSKRRPLVLYILGGIC